MAIKAPYTGFLKHSMPFVSSLILANTLAIFVAAALTASTMHFSAADKASQTALTSPSNVKEHSLQLRADIIFFYMTIPSVMLVATVSANYSLWTDQLSPTYAVIMAVLASTVWIVQVTLWCTCLFGTSRYGFCPNAFKGDEFKLHVVQDVGTESMAVWGVPSLFVLYAVYFAFALMARRRDRAMRLHDEERRSCNERKWLFPTSKRLHTEERLHMSADDHILERPQSGQTNKTPPGVPVEEQSLDRLGRESY